MHDLQSEEGRQVRCDWYAEHVHWENALDQLSFAHVMARREVERKFALDEPDDHARNAMPKHPELEGNTDAPEWHSILNYDEGDGSGVRGGGLVVPQGVGPLVASDGLEDEEGANLLAADSSGSEDGIGSDLYVRIMSDQIMLMMRKIWAENQKRKRVASERAKKAASAAGAKVITDAGESKGNAVADFNAKANVADVESVANADSDSAAAIAEAGAADNNV